MTRSAVLSTAPAVIARRVAWWKEPEETLASTDDYLCRVMTWGTFEDCMATLALPTRDAVTQIEDMRRLAPTLH